ncbi:MAG TPA: hypothetical protein VJA21_17005 [Verrucomicrobiae bacterium]
MKSLRNEKSALFGLRLVAALGVALSMNAAPGDGREHAPQVLPAQTCAFGKSYAEWSVEWWRWAMKLPATQHPLFDTAPVGTGQSGPVWFLGGKFCASGPGAPPCNPQAAERTVTIPAGKALFFPLVNSECSGLEGNGTTYVELRNCVQPAIDGATGLACEIDGNSVPDLDQFRVLSPLFTYTLASHDNVWAAVGGTVGNPPQPIPNGVTTPSVADGYYVLLAPLAVGRHELHFHAAIPAFTFSLDVTYHITVAPRSGDRSED